MTQKYVVIETLKIYTTYTLFYNII